MLVKLSAPGLRPLGSTSEVSFIGRLCEEADYPLSARGKEIFLARQSVDVLPDGFRAYLLFDESEARDRQDVFVLGVDHRYLRHADVVRVEPQRRAIAALYRRSSDFNTLLVTERCDNYCVMCSQPPRERDDSWIVEELREVIPLIWSGTREIGITGGEPALLGEDLVELLELLKRHLPNTAVHVLTNGRRFSEPAFARAVAGIRHPDLMLGVPLYSDLAEEHDFVVQAQGAYNETVSGILNLKRAGVRIEVRIVIHQHTFARLPAFAEFVTRNLLFVDHVALMGLEPTGFAKTNLDALWIDPLDYAAELESAVRTLARAGVKTSVYNHQLCVLPPAIHPFARKSISDWKNLYLGECETCRARAYCAGFFASSESKRSRGISPYREYR